MANKEVLIRYAQIKLEMSKLEAEADMIKEEALASVLEIRNGQEAPVELSEFPGYKFTIQKRKTWEYSPTVKDMEARVKMIKKDEEADGTATFTEKESLVFKSPSDK